MAGRVVRREPGQVNPNLPTGEIELHVEALDVLAESETPPFPIDEETPVDEIAAPALPLAGPAPPRDARRAASCAT